MAREPVPPDVLLWYGNHYLLPIGRAREAVEVESKVLENDPLNLLYRHHLALSLRHCGRLGEAEAELRKVLEVDDKYSLALGTLGAICAQQERLDEALEFTKAAYALTPSGPISGQLAALLVSTAASSRSAELIDNLKSARAYDASAGLAVFHALRGQFAEAAEFAERAIEERYPPFVGIIRPLLQSTQQWHVLAKRMKLPA